MEHAYNFIDITGHVYGRLTVVSFAGKAKSRGMTWNCKCSCGREVIVSANSLRTKNTKSCGCLAKELAAKRTVNSVRRLPEYNIWLHIKTRCLNPNSDAYKKWYGLRGITMCDRWKNSFKNFYDDMGPRPSDKHSIDRENNDGNYEPGNCRWATRKQQGRNKRSNFIIEFNEKKQCLTEWSEELGIPYYVLRHRIKSYGWSIERALSTPVQRR